MSDATKSSDALESELSAKLLDIIGGALAANAPSDIPAEKVKQRVMVLGVSIPPTRTNILAEVTLAAVSAPGTTIPKATLHAIIDAVYDGAAAMPFVQEHAQKYAEQVAEAAAKVDAASKGYVVAGSAKVH